MTQDFQTNVDIANRALQMVGAKYISTFSDNSINATEVAFAYDKMRKAELRRSIWRFAIRRSALRPVDTNSLLLNPPTWSATTLYLQYNIVSYNNTFWISAATLNYNNTPGTSTAGQTSPWQPFFGSLQCEEYDTTGSTGYFAGETLYYPGPEPYGIDFYPGIYTNKVTSSGTNSSGTESVDPSQVQAWSSTTTYNAGDTVSVSATNYISLVNNNLDFAPGSYSSLSAWVSTTAYTSGQQVVDPNTGIIWTAQGNTTGNPPATDSGTNWARPASSPYFQPWLTWTGQAANIGWAAQPNDAYLQPLNLIYPINSGPLSYTGTQNVFRLPHGFLRRAPMNPMIGAVGFLGGPLGNLPDDYQLEGSYFVSNSSSAIVFRFVADFQDVRGMDPMFCEGLAARIAMAIAPKITTNPPKVQTLMAFYKEAMYAARLQNAIETGPIQPAQDEFLNVRM